MKFTHVLLAATFSGVVQSQCVMEKGNDYCNQIEALSFSNFGTAGQYEKVVEMGPGGQCGFANQTYQGGMAPFDEEVRIHQLLTAIVG